jgi:hypothetical protein
MVRAAAAVLQPLDVKENELFNWLMGYGYQTRFYLNPVGNVLGLDSSEKKIEG